MNMNEKQYESSTKHEDFIPQSGKIKTKNKPSKWLAVLLAMVMLVSGLVFASGPVQAANGEYTTSKDVIDLDIELKQLSGNDQTRAYRVWAGKEGNADYIFFAVNLLHDFQYVEIDGGKADAYDKYAEGVAIWINNEKHEPQEGFSKGPTHKAYWVVAKFPISIIDPSQDGNYSYFVSAQSGNDHDSNHNVSGIFTVTVPKPKSVKATITVKKILSGRDWQSGDSFTFKLFDNNDVEKGTATATSENTVSFPTLTFTKTGTYLFTVTESPGDLPGVAYDVAPKTVKITVTKNKNKLVAKVSPKILEVTNVYTPAPAKATIRVQKLLLGRDWQEGDSFTFKLVGKTNALVIDQVIVENGNAASFKELTFNEEGKYTFFVSEVAGYLPGVSYDKSIKEVEVNVTYNSTTGKYETVVSEVGAAGGLSASNLLTFTNTYKPDPVKASIKVQKILNGRDWKEGDTFTFKLSGRIGRRWITREVTVMDGQVKAFDELTFAHPGEYEFSISEVKGSLPGVHYDRSVKKAKVSVTKDNATGKLTALVTGGGTAGGNTVTASDLFIFTNKYKAKSTKATIFGSKSLEGRALKKGEFTFKLYRADAEGRIIGNAIASTRNDANGNWKFTLNYRQGQAGRYYYVVKEVDDGKDYIGYATNEILYTVEVSDNLAGAMVADVSVSSGVSTEFINTYLASGSWTPEVTKELTGRALKYQEFTFVLKDSEGQVLQTVKNDEDGSIPFGPIEYSVKDIDKKFYYTISEVIPPAVEQESGMTYDNWPIFYQVDVSDPDGEGTLSVAVYSSVKDTVFRNDYKASGSLELEATKVLNGRDLKEDEFNFLLKNDDGIEVGNATNAQDGSIVFNLDFTQEDIGNTYTYTMEEEAGTENGMDYATNVVNVTVVVSDAGNGDLGFDVIYEDEAIFTNTYEASVNYLLNVTKELTGGDLVEGEFEFELLDAEDNQLQKVSNLASGQVPFAPLSFDQNDIGKTYTYKVRELLGDQDDIDYDDTVYTFTLRIEDLGEGALDVIYESEADELKFTNIKEQVAGAEETEDKGKEDDDTKEKVKGDEVKGDDDKKAPVSGEQASIYRYLSYVMLLLAASTVVLVRRFSKKEEAAE